MYNATATDARLIVYVVCGHKPTGCKVVSASPSVGSGSTLLDGIACPAGTPALDGGAKTVGHSPLIQVSGSIDQGALGWAIKMNNTAPSQQQVDGYVICAGPTHHGDAEPKPEPEHHPRPAREIARQPLWARCQSRLGRPEPDGMRGRWVWVPLYQT